ncbi:MAG: ABC transporter permease [Candidatus Izemoplasmataceae bacterium]
MMITRALIKRHLTLYLRDRWAIFFSFLSVIIILGLFILFLKNTFGSDFNAYQDAAYVSHAWILAGVLVVSTVTVPLGFLAIMVQDLELKTINDFYVAPISRTQIVLSYFFSALVIGSVFGLFNLAIGITYLLIQFGYFIGLFNLMILTSLTILSASLFSSLFFLVITYIKTLNAHGTLSILLGTLIGFLTGLYVPIGALSNTLRTVLSIMPFMQMATLFRKAYMADAFERVFVNAEGMKASVIDLLGVNLKIFSIEISTAYTLLIILGWMGIFLGLSILRLKTFKRK